MTAGFDLCARFIIHTVGPVWQGGEASEASLLASCYRNSLRVAQENSLTSIAFPAISCGAYGYPAELAAKIALSEITANSAHGLQVTICCFSTHILDSYRKAMDSNAGWPAISLLSSP